jgi:hypothetical protein
MELILRFYFTEILQLQISASVLTMYERKGIQGGLRRERERERERERPTICNSLPSKNCFLELQNYRKFGTNNDNFIFSLFW